MYYKLDMEFNLLPCLTREDLLTIANFSNNETVILQSDVSKASSTWRSKY